MHHPYIGYPNQEASLYIGPNTDFMRWTIHDNNNKHLLNNSIIHKRAISGGFVSELQYTIMTLKQDYYSFENWMFHFDRNRQGNIPCLLVNEGRKRLINLIISCSEQRTFYLLSIAFGLKCVICFKPCLKFTLFAGHDEIPISQENKDNLRANHMYLIDNLVLDDLLQCVVVAGVVSKIDHKCILQADSKQEANIRFLHILRTKSEKGYHRFLDCLKSTGQGDIVDVLTMSKYYVYCM